jgi:serine/threonine protein kinase
MWTRRRSDPSETPKPGATIAGKYRVERVLGEGGMGLVLAARHTRLDETVAIKMLRPDVLRSRDEVQRFLREGRACSKLKSEHVVRILDLGEADGEVPFLVMEQLEGRDLAALLRGRGPLDVATTLTVVLEACEAVAEAHALGIIHRDLKPANLFLARAANGGTKVKVLDFGISKILEEAAQGDLSLTATRTLMGSPLYMAPELMRSARAADPRSDVWALGCILYELLTGTTPWQGETITELCVRVLEETPRPITSFRADVPQALEAVVARCLAKKPEDRYQSVMEAATQLAALAGDPGRAQLVAIERVVHAAELRQRDRASGPISGERTWESEPGAGTLRGFGTTFHLRPPRARAAMGIAAVLTVALAAGLAFSLLGREQAGQNAAAQPTEPLSLPNLATLPAPSPSPSTSVAGDGSAKGVTGTPPAAPKFKPAQKATVHAPKSSPYFDDPN